MIRLIGYDELKGRGIPHSKMQLWRLEKAGRFPRRVRISAARYGYIEAEIDQFINDRIAERDSASETA
jgi:prophage regulatory protein